MQSQIFAVFNFSKYLFLSDNTNRIFVNIHSMTQTFLEEFRRFKQRIYMRLVLVVFGVRIFEVIARSECHEVNHYVGFFICLHEQVLQMNITVSNTHFM